MENNTDEDIDILKKIVHNLAEEKTPIQDYRVTIDHMETTVNQLHVGVIKVEHG